MKKILNISLVVLVVCLVSCNKEYPDITTDTDFDGVFVRNEGGTISFYNEDDKTVTADIYKDVNGTSVGENILAFTSIGNVGYILKGTTAAQSIEEVDLETFKTVRTVDGFNNLTDLKTVSSKFLYATQGIEGDENSGSVIVLDSINQETPTIIEVGKYPTRIAYNRGKKLYVANSGTGEYTESTVMVIDITQKSVIDIVELEQKVDETTTNKLKTPVEMVIDMHQDLWVLCKGVLNEAGDAVVNAGLAKVSYIDNSVTVFPFQNGYAGPGRNGLVRSLGGETIYYLNNGTIEEENGTYAMEIDSETLPSLKDRLFKEEPYINMIFNVIGINPYTGKFFCGMDGEADSNGTVYIFNRYGYNDDSFEVGVKPRQFTFVR